MTKQDRVMKITKEFQKILKDRMFINLDRTAVEIVGEVGVLATYLAEKYKRVRRLQGGQKRKAK